MNLKTDDHGSYYDYCCYLLLQKLYIQLLRGSTPFRVVLIIIFLMASG